MDWVQLAYRVSGIILSIVAIIITIYVYKKASKISSDTKSLIKKVKNIAEDNNALINTLADNEKERDKFLRKIGKRSPLTLEEKASIRAAIIGVYSISDSRKAEEIVLDTFKREGIKFISQPKLPAGMMPDFVIKKKEKKIPGEIKNYPKRVIANILIQKLRQQMLRYMEVVGSDEAILIIFAPEITDLAYQQLTKKFPTGKKINVIRVSKDKNEVFGDKFREFWSKFIKQSCFQYKYIAITNFGI